MPGMFASPSGSACITEGSPPCSRDMVAMSTLFVGKWLIYEKSACKRHRLGLLIHLRKAMPENLSALLAHLRNNSVPPFFEARHTGCQSTFRQRATFCDTSHLIPINCTYIWSTSSITSIMLTQEPHMTL